MLRCLKERGYRDGRACCQSNWPSCLWLGEVHLTSVCSNSSDREKVDADRGSRYRTSLIVYFFLTPLTDVMMCLFSLPRTTVQAPPIPFIHLELVLNGVKLLSIHCWSVIWLPESRKMLVLEVFSVEEHAARPSIWHSSRANWSTFNSSSQNFLLWQKKVLWSILSLHGCTYPLLNHRVLRYCSWSHSSLLHGQICCSGCSAQSRGGIYFH